MKRYLPNRVVTLGIAIAIFTVPTAASQAQTDLPCFLQDANGNVLDLGSLCGVGSPSLPDVFQVRIKRRDARIPVIDVKFNDNQTFEMLFDTGASGIAITRQMAAALRIQPEGIAISDTAGGRIEVPIGRVNSVEVGGVKVSNLEVTINQYLDIGLLGNGFFGNYDVTIKENVIEFRHR
ncbi:MAG TPA: aspartyl protease [Cyanobacteria bacterium UBA12227]|nr:aspartyl protease [Cyanobacteria bacterium UBA12227]HAX89436.1 aspartyl protease [Cyanobacteria bacterium UBA11370]HBY75476.1 aspartyl protease [Cyanobacteria bacterium UBA11148]